MKKILPAVLLSLSALTAPAATVTWDGSASGYWSNGGNWAGGVAPAPGDSLIFPVSATRYITTNNFAAGTVFGGVAFMGSNYVLRGNRIVLEDDLRAVAQSGPVTIDLAITVDSPLAVTQFEARYDSIPTFNGAIQNVDPGHVLQFVNGRINVSGAITGAGDVKVSSCDLYLVGSGVNTYTGHTEISSATVYLNKTVANAALPPNGVVERGGGSGYLKWIRDEQIADSSQLHHLHLDLDGQTETLDDYYVGNLLTNGTLTVSGDILEDGYWLSGNGDGRLYLPVGNHRVFCDGPGNVGTVRNELAGPGTLVKMGTGEFWLEHSNSLTGAIIVSNGVLQVRHSHAFGSTAAGVSVRAGASVKLRNNVIIEGEPITLQGTGFFDPESEPWYPLGYATLHAVSPTNAWNGPVFISGNVSVGAQEEGLGDGIGSTLRIGGSIQGTGTLMKEGKGTVVFTGTAANTFNGGTWVREGLLQLDKNGGLAIPGNLTIGEVYASTTCRAELLRSSQIADDATLTIESEDSLKLNNQSDVIQNLILQEGSIYTDNGTLVLTGFINAGDIQGGPAYSSIVGNGRLQLSTGVHEFYANKFPDTDITLNITCDITGTGSILKTGAGGLSLGGSNSFTGTFTALGGLTRVFVAPHAFGSTGAGTVVSNAAILQLINTTIAGETLTLLDRGTIWGAFTAVWDGPVILPVDGHHGYVASEDNSTMDLRGVISGPGDLYATNGTVLLSGSQPNTQSGHTWVIAGTLLLTKTNATAIAGSVRIGLDSAPAVEVMRLLRANQIADGSLVVIAATGRWELNGFNETIGGLLDGTSLNYGEIALGGATLTVDTTGYGFNCFFAGTITGKGGLTKRGPDDLFLSGDNTYDGNTLVQAGSLYVGGEQPNSPVNVLTGGRLLGHGVVGHLTAQSGGMTEAGLLMLEPELTTSNLLLQAGSALRLKLYGSQSNQFVQVRGSVTLNSPALELDWQYVPKPGDTFTLIDNDGADAANGAFTGFPAGQFIGPGGHLMDMSYANNVTLRVLSPGQTNLPPGIGLVVTGGNGNGTIDPNECNQVRVSLFNNSTNPLPSFHTMLLSDAPELTITQPASDYLSIPAQDSAMNVTPFQISTTDKLQCGSNLLCRLRIYTTNNSGYEIPLALPTGTPGEPVVYTAAPNLPVLDGVNTDSSIQAAALSTYLARVEVSVFVEHPVSSDLVLTLIAPNGASVPLAADLGNGANYGTNCADAGRTTFADDALASIGSASAPFVGVFRPMGYLSALRGMPGADVAGNWTLRVNDHVHFNTGTLRCWSLTLAPAVCTDGGGECDRCPGAIAGAITEQDEMATGYVYAFGGAPANCFSNATCGGVIAGNYRYRAHTFTNLSAQPTCVSVRCTAQCDNNPTNLLGVTAYLGVYNPAAVCENFLGDRGAFYVNGVPRSFSFQAPASSVFQIVVTTIYSTECSGYSLEVESPDLCPVRLHINALDANTMRLGWPTHAGGYELQRTPAVVPPNWSDVNVQPVVTGDRFVVTNAVVDTNGFYRLRKP